MGQSGGDSRKRYRAALQRLHQGRRWQARRREEAAHITASICAECEPALASERRTAPRLGNSM